MVDLQTCSNTIGSYYCSCENGYELSNDIITHTYTCISKYIARTTRTMHMHGSYYMCTLYEAERHFEQISRNMRLALATAHNVIAAYRTTWRI